MIGLLLLVSVLFVGLTAVFVMMKMNDQLNRPEKASLLKEIDTLRSVLEDEEKIGTEASVHSDESVPEDSSASEITPPAEDAPVPEKTPAASETGAVDYRAGVVSLLDQLGQDIDEEDLPEFCQQMKDWFDVQEKKPYYLKLDLSEETEDIRTVVIGDTHCDPVSLSAILRKLLSSEYDYFGKGRIVFLGDYLDRGSIFFEYFRLLTRLKTLMGDRCILMKGNHELIEFDKYSGLLESMVYPSNTCPLLNEYCSEDKEFLTKFAEYVTNLPYYLLFKTRRGTDLLVHGGIPRDRYLDVCSISPDTGEMILSDPSVQLDYILDNMIWSDPHTAPSKMQGPSARFYFGRDQFTRFMEANGLNRLFRSHEPVVNGVESFYNDRLFTVFSNGGAENECTGYPDVLNPVFGILSAEGDFRVESIFLKRVRLQSEVSLFETVLFMGKKAEGEVLNLKDLHLNPEFFVEKHV